jgi:hypothetical protein
MYKCEHKREKSFYVEKMDDWTGETYYEWEYTTEYTSVDIGIGAFKCTMCGEVGYYTGSWKNYYENDIPCTASEFVGDTERKTVKKAIKYKRRGDD